MAPPGQRDGSQESTMVSDGEHDESGALSFPLPPSPKQLVAWALAVYSEFNSAQLTLDSHTDASLRSHKIVDGDAQTFVKQVVYGMVRYRKLFGCLLDAFYHVSSGLALRSEASLYKLFSYLAIFRLQELSFPQFRRLVVSQDAQKMAVLLRYLCSKEQLQEVVREDWLKLYDKQFVDGLIAELLGWGPQLQQLLGDLEAQVYGTKLKGGKDSTAGSSLQQRTATAPEPFNLSQPRPKPLPAEEPPPQVHKARPAPRVFSGPTKEQRALEEARAQNRRMQQERQADPRFQPFRLRVLERPMQLETIRQEIAEEMAASLAQQVVRSRPPPPPPTADVKLNAAAIFREDALYRRKQAQEAALLQQYEMALHDSSEFSAWQQRMLQLDEAQRQLEVERRRAEMAAAQEAAIRAKEHRVQENLAMGAELKQARVQRSEGLRRAREQQLASNQQRAVQVQEERAQAAVAAERVAQERKLAAEELRRQKAEDARLALERQAKEAAERRDIILQLRALERAPKQRVKLLDPTSCPDHGLLEQMSLTELRERLVLAKQRQQREEEAQRQRILAAKQQREATLVSKAANIQRIRHIAAQHAHSRRASTAATKAQLEAQQQERQEQEAVLTLQRLQEKHARVAAERERLAAEEKRVQFMQLQQAASSAGMVEENILRGLTEGAMQRAREQRGLEAEAVKQQEQRCRLQSVRQRQRQQKQQLAAYDAKVQDIAREAAAAAAAADSRKAQLVSSIKSFESKQRTMHVEQHYIPSKGPTSTMRERLIALGQGTAQL